MTRTEKRKPRKYPKVTETYLREMDGKQKPNPLKALLKMYPAPWKVRKMRSVAWKYFITCKDPDDLIEYEIVAATDSLLIARAIANLGNGK